MHRGVQTLSGLALLGSALAASPAVAAPADTFAAAIAATKSAMMTDPQKALVGARSAERIAAAMPPSREARVALATAQWLEGEALLYSNDTSHAAPIAEAALAVVQRDAPFTKLHGDLVRSRGAIAATGGHVQDALADYQRAYDIFRRAGEKRSQAIALQDIGGIYLDAGDYQRVLDYYGQSAEVFHDDPFLLLTTHNNRGEVLREMKRLPEAVSEFRAALAAARHADSPVLRTRILTNLALAQVDTGDLAAAQQSVATALQLSASGDAHSWRNFVFGADAKLAAARGNYAEAATMLQQAFAGLDITKTDMPYREFHQLASVVYEKLGNQSAALANLRAYQRLDNQARNLVASTNAQLMAARFDFTNQNLKIANLKQGQLQRDIALERQKTNFRTILFGGLLLVGTIIFGLLLAGYLSIRRSRNQVRAANDNLTLVNVDLEKALLAKTEFLATTSHEIRTPLNGILGMTQVLLTNERVAGEVRDQIQVVQGAGEAMRALVDDILDVAKMETGEVAIVRDETNLITVLTQSVDLWKGQAQAKGVLVTQRRAEAVPSRIMSDEARLRQIVNNLLSNAVKFTLEGSVELLATVEQAEAGEMLVLRVVDTGIGIAPDQHELIFEAFRQVDSGTSRQFGGTGLGLAICRRLAAAMGGTIEVESKLGKGATFTLRLPLERLAPAVAAEDSGPGLAAATLLVVERNVLNQCVMRAMLGDVARSVEVAVSGRGAIEAIETDGITHVLVEAGSATLDDHDILGSLREIAHRARASGALCSILFTPDEILTVAALTAVGATQIIAKPIDGASLIQTLGAAYGEDPRPVVEQPALDRSAA
jgi:signal transduction histidine kinase